MTTTTTTTRTARKAAASKAAPTPVKAAPVITRTATGALLLTGLPFMVDGIGADGAPGRSSRVMNTRGLGWTWFAEGDVKGWTTANVPGAVAECVDTLAGYGVTVTDASKAAAAPGKARTVKAAPVKAATVKAAPVKATPASTGSTLAAAITAALAADGVAPEIIAAAITAATAAADKIAKSVSPTVSAPEKVRTVKARKDAAPVTVRKVAPVKAAPVKAAPVTPEADGTRRITGAVASAKSARQGLSRAGIVGVSVRKDGRDLVAYRADGAAVSADVDAVIIAAIA